MAVTTLSHQDLIHDIRRRTSAANRNNVTRTAAYLDFFQRHPEVEWAFLAHMVSRNGGWNMTDLKGDWLPRILTPKEMESFFAFLERSNWLIFHDAYAQLLLYEWMKETGRDLTSLLPQLGVSRFMIPYWQAFLQNRDSRRLTRALIVNEQQYIQQRVVQQPFYRHRVLETLTFQARSVLSLNQILFPYRKSPGDERPRLIGIAVHRFSSVEQRIRMGKAMYVILTQDQERWRQFQEWAVRVPHTGSRADYWPQFFSRHQPSGTRGRYTERFEEGRLIPGQPKLYSPRLADAWPDMEHPPADGTDWFTDPKWHAHTDEDATLPTMDETDYLRSLELVDTVMVTVEAIRS